MSFHIKSCSGKVERKVMHQLSIIAEKKKNKQESRTEIARREAERRALVTWTDPWQSS